MLWRATCSETSDMAMPGYPCPVCRRQGGAVTVQGIGDRLAHLCSAECATLFIKARGDIKMQHVERECAAVGGNDGGAYLDRIGKTDLASLSRDEWTEFCFKVFVGTCAELKRRADDEIPF